MMKIFKLLHYHKMNIFYFEKIFIRQLQLSFYSTLKEFLQIDVKSIKKITLVKAKNKFRNYKGNYTISIDKYEEMLMNHFIREGSKGIKREGKTIKYHKLEDRKFYLNEEQEVLSLFEELDDITDEFTE